jgi:hypothetical protein
LAGEIKRAFKRAFERALDLERSVHPESQGSRLSRQNFLNFCLASGAALVVAGLTGCSGETPPPPSPIVETRLVEVTRIVEEEVAAESTSITRELTSQPLIQEEEKLIW